MKQIAIAFVAAAALLHGAAPQPSWEFTPDPKLPNVLIIGDSISVGYTRDVRAALAGKANVYRPMRPGGKVPANCFSTAVGLEELAGWLGDTKYSVIHFNWGLHDLCYRNPESKTPGNRDKVNGKVAVPLEEYRANLDRLVQQMKKTGATLIWASTTVVPDGDVGRFTGDDLKYNAVAKEVMAKHGVRVNDLHAVTAAMKPELTLGAGNVHYKPEGYKALGEHVARAIEQALAERK